MHRTLSKYLAQSAGLGAVLLTLHFAVEAAAQVGPAQPVARVRSVSGNPIVREQQLNAVDTGDGYLTRQGRRKLERLAGALAVEAPDAAALARITQPGGALAGYQFDEARNGRMTRVTILRAPADERTRQLANPQRIDEPLRAVRGAAGVVSASPVFVDPRSGLFQVPTEEIIVRLKPGVDAPAYFGNDWPNTRPFLDAPDQFIVRLPGRTSEQILAESDRHMQDNRVLWAEPNFLNQVVSTALPDDKYFGRQWHLLHNGQLSGFGANFTGLSGADINVSNAWNFTTGSTNIIVAVLDDGVQLTHPDLTPNLATNRNEIPGNGIDDDGNGYIDDVLGWDFTAAGYGNNANPKTSTNNHGTAVAGLAVARGSNAVGAAGVAYTSRLLPVTVIGNVAVDQLAAAFYYAGGINAAGVPTWRGADVLNLSFGGPQSEILDAALEMVAVKGRGGLGCPIFAAAGNASESWHAVEFNNIPNGQHTFRCEYSKTSPSPAGQDAVWLGDVQFPGSRYEHFDGGVLPPGWITGGSSPWTVDTTPDATFGAVKGALRSGTNSSGSSNWVQLTWTNTANVTGRGFVTYRTSTAPGNEIRIYVRYPTLFVNDSGVADDNLGIAYPASHPVVISVGATTDYNLRSEYSQFGTNLTLVAPGGGGRNGLFTTDRTGIDGYQTSTADLLYQNPNCFENFRGTSAAAPVAAGVGALVLSMNTNLSAFDVREILTSTGVKIGNEAYVNGRNNFFGYGKVDASAAVLAAPSYSILPPDTQHRILTRGLNLSGINPSIGTNQGNTVLEILYGGALTNASGVIGQNGLASDNRVVVSGAGSRWVNTGSLSIGNRGSGNQLLVTDGGMVVSAGASLGISSQPFADNNLAVVTGPGSLWTNSLTLTVGSSGRGNQLVVTNGGTVVASNIIVGSQLSSTNNLVTVDGGTLRGALEIRRGTNVLNSGLIEAATLRMPVTNGSFEFKGGTLSSGGSTVTNGIPFIVGNGASPAQFNFAGNALHTFNAGITLRANATLAGNGTLSGTLTVQSGATLTPGASIGALALSNPPVLQGTVVMELSANGPALTNDQILVSGNMTYSGTLVVTNLGPALTAGNRFKLFSAGGYAGAFTSITLPSVPAGLVWINNLMLDGSIEVAAPTTLVWTTADSGPGSLRHAILFANASGSASVITFTNTLSGQTILLTSGQLTLSNTLATVAINASSLPGGITLSGNNSSRVFEVAAGAVVHLSALNIQNGYAPNGDNPTNYGGGILNRGTLALTNCTLTGNQALQGSKPVGGAIANCSAAATLTLQNCLVSSNRSDAYGGGGVDINNGVARFNQCTFTANSSTNGNGGAINVQAGSVTINQCTVSGNSALTGGGVAKNGTLTISNSIVAGNVAASGPNISGSFSGAHNLTSGNPLLGPLGNYGGPTLTMPPLPGSPAIDGCTGGTSFTTDQRGKPRIVGAFADIGAVEGVFNSSFPLVNVTKLGSGNVRFGFTNLSGLSYTVLASTNVAAPLNTWSNLGSAVEAPPGTFQFTDPQATNYPRRFYHVQGP